jgi:hypothetical protein
LDISRMQVDEEISGGFRGVKEVADARRQRGDVGRAEHAVVVSGRIDDGHGSRGQRRPAGARVRRGLRGQTRGPDEGQPASK